MAAPNPINFELNKLTETGLTIPGQGGKGNASPEILIADRLREIVTASGIHESKEEIGALQELLAQLEKRTGMQGMHWGIIYRILRYCYSKIPSDQIIQTLSKECSVTLPQLIWKSKFQINTLFVRGRQFADMQILENTPPEFSRDYVSPSDMSYEDFQKHYCKIEFERLRDFLCSPKIDLKQKYDFIINVTSEKSIYMRGDPLRFVRRSDIANKMGLETVSVKGNIQRMKNKTDHTAFALFHTIVIVFIELLQERIDEQKRNNNTSQRNDQISKLSHESMVVETFSGCVCTLRSCEIHDNVL